MSLEKLSHKHKQIAVMLLSNTKVPDIAEKFNMHPKSVYCILVDPKFREFEGNLFIHMAYRYIQKQLDNMEASWKRLEKEKKEKREKKTSSFQT